MRVILAQPRGFCAGVIRAIEIVERSLEKFGAPVYVRHEIVHNRHVVERLERMGAVFVDELDEIPDGAVTIFSAHGVAQSIIDEAATSGLLARLGSDVFSSVGGDPEDDFESAAVGTHRAAWWRDGSRGC